MSLFRNFILPLLGVGVEYHLHSLNTELVKQQHTETEKTTKLIGITDLITGTLSTKLETYRDACEEKLKKYSNYLLITGILIGVLGQLLPIALPIHCKYILGNIPLINLYYFFLTNTVGCLISCFIICILMLNDISYYMIHVNHLWSNIETNCITTLQSNEPSKFEIIQELLSTHYYTIYHDQHIQDLEGWFNTTCYSLHCIIIISSGVGILSFIISFILSLAAILIPLSEVIGDSRSYEAFMIVISIITIEICSLILYIGYRLHTKKQIDWYSSKTGERVVFPNSITIRVL
jgi:hypothetical protein